MKRDFKSGSKLKIFFSYFKPYRGLFALDMLCAVLVSLADILFPYLSRYSLLELLPNQKYRAFFIISAIMLGAYIIKALFNYIMVVVGHIMGLYIESDMRRDVFTHIQKLSFSYFDKKRTGELMSRITNDLFEITELAHHGPEEVAVSSLTIIGSLIVVFAIEWKLALVLAVLLFVGLGVTLFSRNRLRKSSRGVKEKTGKINAAIEMGIAGMRTARAFANEEEEREKFISANLSYVSARKEYYRSMGTFMASMDLVLSSMSVMVVIVGGFLIMKGDMISVDLFTFTLYVGAFVAPIRRLTNFSELLFTGRAGFDRFLEIMREEPEIKDRPDAVEMKKTKGVIEFKDVSFSYDPQKPILRDINLKIESGEKIAFVGSSGSGKTTLVNLVPRFYEVTEGAVLIDGRDIRDVTQESLRRNVGIIQQDVFIFAATIMENIRYGRPDATDAEVVAAAIKAEIHKDISEMPDGYDTPAGERGVMLSGGQKQRISIARAILKNPKILILDEATSSLDSVTERKIQESLDELSVGRTTLYIAHRLSTVKNADKVAVVEDEGIVEYGSPAELLEKGGRFRELIEAQSFNEDL